MFLIKVLDVSNDWHGGVFLLRYVRSYVNNSDNSHDIVISFGFGPNRVILNDCVNCTFFLDKFGYVYNLGSIRRVSNG